MSNDGTLELSVYKDTCDVFRCGTCVFDFDFEVEVPLDAPLALRLGAAVCASEPTSFALELTLPLDEAESGVVCQPLEANALAQYGRTRGTCGNRNMPCGDCNTTDVTSCAEGLVCTALAMGDERCLEACETDDDCVGGLTTCQEGLCRAADSF